VRVEERGHRGGKVPQRLLLHHLRSCGQPRVLSPGFGELSALLQVSWSACPARAPVRVLFHGHVPHVPSLAAMIPQHGFLGRAREAGDSGTCEHTIDHRRHFRGGEAALSLWPEGPSLHAAILVSLRQLFPVCADEPDLPALYAYPDGQWLRANMVATADGAAFLNGVTAGISSDTDRRVFALLRALSDVILVGAATVREERYKPARLQELWRDLRAGRPPTPPIAVVTRRLDLDPESPLITRAPPHARTIVITTASAPQDIRAKLSRHADVIISGQETVDVKAAIGALAERGHRRMLTEGGPQLLAQLAEAGLMDELCLTISPLMAGPGASRIVAGAPGTGLPLPLTLAHVLEADGFLLCRYTRKDHRYTRKDH
jgi:riboflavin biosynthesis pyrimidine reductase